MLCRRKLVLFLTVACLCLLYISANHYMSGDESDVEQNNNRHDKSNGESNGMLDLNSVDVSQRPKNHQKDGENARNEQKFHVHAPPLPPNTFLQQDQSVEFRTTKPLAITRKIGKTI